MKGTWLFTVQFLQLVSKFVNKNVSRFVTIKNITLFSCYHER